MLFRDARIGRRAHIPVAQAFRLEVCSCCGVVTVGAKTLTPARGELQNPLARLAVGSCEVRLWEARNRSIVKLKEGLELLPLVQAHFTVKRMYFSLLALLPVLPLALNAQDKPAGSWSGVVVSSACNADEAFNESPECTKEVPGAKLALYDDTNRVMYSLEPQSAVSAHLGDTVTVRGTLDGETIRMAAIESMSIGLAVGQKAPAFSLRDQFGHTQTLDSLKGVNGTVLLFFRSADW
jgi:hypothetical protein